MAKSLYDLKNIYKVEALADEFDVLMREAVADCRTRPQITKAREVTLKIKIVPSKVDAERVVISHHVLSKRPEKKVPEYVMDTTINDGLKFNPHSPSVPDQDTFLDDED